MKRPFVLVLLAAQVLFARAVMAQEARVTPLNPLSPDALAAVFALFNYDEDIPLAPHVVERTEDTLSVREKFVITGVRGDRVPGYLAVPKSGPSPYAVVLLLHAGAFSKDSWWTEQSYGGRDLTDDLLSSGFAVVALDAQFHGERSGNADYLPIPTMYFAREWFGRIRDLMIESIGDYRRLLDHLSSDSRLDLDRVGTVGHSTGGIMGLDLAAVDRRIRTVVAVVAALSTPWLYPITPTNLAPAIKVPVLLMVGRSDPLISMADSEGLYESLPGPKEFVVYDSGHELPNENNRQAAEWLRRHLQSR